MSKDNHRRIVNLDDKTEIVAALAEIGQAWEQEHARVQLQIEALTAGVSKLQGFHAQLVGSFQFTREDCADLKKLDGRSLKGAKPETDSQ